MSGTGDGSVAEWLGREQRSVPEPPWEEMLWEGKAWPWSVQLLAGFTHARSEVLPSGL